MKKKKIDLDKLDRLTIRIDQEDGTSFVFTRYILSAHEGLIKVSVIKTLSATGEIKKVIYGDKDVDVFKNQNASVSFSTDLHTNTIAPYAYQLFCLFARSKEVIHICGISE